MDASKASAIVLLFLAFVSATVVVNGKANVVFELKHRSEGKPSVTTRYGRSLSAYDVGIGTERIEGNGMFFAKLMIGNPPKAYFPLVDTSTDLSWVYCSGCRRCPSVSSFKFPITHYDTKASSKGRNVSCNDPMCPVMNVGKEEDMCTKDGRGVCKYQVSYASGGVSKGHLVSDTVHLDKVTGNGKTSTVTADLVFGCGVDQAGGLEVADLAFDGEIGFSRSNITLLSQLASKNLVKNSFAHCLNSQFRGGLFALGEVEMRDEIKTTPLIPKEDQYKLKIKKFSVNGKSMNTQDIKGAMFDISTLYNLFPDRIYRALLKEIMDSHKDAKFVVDEPYLCFYFTGSVDDFPTLKYQFEGGIELVLPPNRYISINNDKWCAMIMNSANSPINKDYFVIGENTLLEKLVVYDLEKQVMGWRNYNCSSGIKMKDEKSGEAYSVVPHNTDEVGISGAMKLGEMTSLLFVSAIMSSYLAF